jgi:hypothetical protein
VQNLKETSIFDRKCKIMLTSPSPPPPIPLILRSPLWLDSEQASAVIEAHVYPMPMNKERSIAVSLCCGSTSQALNLSITKLTLTVKTPECKIKIFTRKLGAILSCKIKTYR